LILGALILAQAAISTTITWNTITLGAPAASVRARLGDPLRVLLFDNPSQRIARYWLPGSDSTYALVIEERGYIKGLEAFTNAPPTEIVDNVPPDPLGVRLGETLDSVKLKAPMLHQSTADDGTLQLVGRVSTTAGALYEFKNNRVSSFHWGITIPRDGSAGPPLADPAGNSMATAILNMQRNETDGVAWEYRYLAFHPCSDDARWRLKQQGLMNQGGRAYDVLDVVCPATKQERDFYFDITSFYGEL
jgi:hypothetical protein